MSFRRISIVVAAFTLSVVALAQFDGPAPLSWRWAQPTAVPPGGPPIVNGDTVFVASGQRMYALDIETGNQRWRFPSGEPLNAYFRQGAVVADGNLIAAADDKTVYAVDIQTGQQRWTYQLPEQVRGQAVVAGKNVVFALADNSIFAVNTMSGAPAWPNSNRIFDGILGQIGAFQGSVLIFTQSLKLYSIDVATQKVGWNVGFTTLEPDARPVVFNDAVYITSGTFVSCISAANGRPRWQRNTNENLASNPAASAEGVIAITRDGKVLTFQANGTPISKTGQDLGSLTVIDPANFGRIGALCTTNGGLTLIDLAKNSTLWKYTVRPMTSVNEKAEAAGGDAPGRGGPQMGGSGGGRGGAGQGGGTSADSKALPTYVTAAAPPVVSGNTLLLLARDGSLLAFDKDTGVDVTGPVVKMTWPSPGSQVSSQGLEFAFRVEDQATGVNDSTVKVDIDGQAVDFQLQKNGVIVVSFSALSKNRPLQDGRRVITVSASDWLGNVTKATYSLTIDRTLPPVNRPKDKEESDPRAGGPSRGGGGR